VSAVADALKADFSDEGDRYRYRDVLSGLFAMWFAEHSAAEIHDALSATTVLYEQYRTFAEVASDERVGRNPLFTRMQQPGVGEYLAPGLPASFDGSHPASTPAPNLGQDTAGLLAERLGLSSAEISRLQDAGTIAS
jgi:2-methylfumaryl-CoA isomerase